MKLGACVSLLVKCQPLVYDRMQQEKTKVAQFAKVTSRSDRKTFLAYNMSLSSSRVFLKIPFVFCFVSLYKFNEDRCRDPARPIAWYEQ